MPQIIIAPYEILKIEFGFEPSSKELRQKFYNWETFKRTGYDLVEYLQLSEHIKKGFLYLVKFIQPPMTYFTVALSYSDEIIKDWITRLLLEESEPGLPRFRSIEVKRIKGFQLEDI
jgi:hypothetical protein